MKWLAIFFFLSLIILLSVSFWYGFLYIKDLLEEKPVKYHYQEPPLEKQPYIPFESKLNEDKG